jgi:hypothetical protein
VGWAHIPDLGMGRRPKLHGMQGVSGAITQRLPPTAAQGFLCGMSRGPADVALPPELEMGPAASGSLTVLGSFVDVRRD